MVLNVLFSALTETISACTVDHERHTNKAKSLHLLACQNTVLLLCLSCMQEVHLGRAMSAAAKTLYASLHRWFH